MRSPKHPLPALRPTTLLAAAVLAGCEASIYGHVDVVVPAGLQASLSRDAPAQVVLAVWDDRAAIATLCADAGESVVRSATIDFGRAGCGAPTEVEAWLVAVADPAAAAGLCAESVDEIDFGSAEPPLNEPAEGAPSGSGVLFAENEGTPCQAGAISDEIRIELTEG